jgi:TPR repeat protein
MKKILLVMFIVLFTASSVFCGEFEKTLKKAEQGLADAQIDLAVMYYIGQGVAQNYKQAVYWITKAAEQGHPYAQYNLGVSYDEGQGVTQDYKQAVYWWTRAAEQGNVPAQSNLGFLYVDGRVGVPQDYKQAVYWLTKAAEQGDDSAQSSLGFLYETGQGVTQDYKQAAYWYTKAAGQGNIWAQKILGAMYDNGQGVLKDYKQAVYWRTKAAQQGDIYTQYSLGEMYYDGRGVSQNYTQAAYWLTKAAEQGDAKSQASLGMLYDKGYGVTQNFKLAYVWYSLAAAQGTEDVIRNRDIAAKKLTPYQLSEAQDLATKIQYQIDNGAESSKSPPAKPGTGEIINTGTSFFITRDGYLLTCLHVVEGAARIETYVGDKMYPASLIRSDPNNDLAILKINGSFPALAFSPHRSAKMGQDIFTVGFPNPGLQGISAKYTKGTVSSLTGFQDDLRLYQISVPIQPGNSGGALLDEHGNILGVVIAMLNAKTAFQVSGNLPQNVNYAVKSLYAQAMIDTLPGVSGKLLSPSRNKTNVIENAQKSTVMVVCYD